MVSELVRGLRRTAVREQHFSLPGDCAQAELVRNLREAADAIEAYEQALVDIAGWKNWQTPTWREIAQNALPEHVEREHLEREAVTPEPIDWPIIPWPSDYPDRASYHKAMVGWHKTITRIQRLGDA